MCTKLQIPDLRNEVKESYVVNTTFIEKLSQYQKIYLSSQIIKQTCYIVEGESLIDQFACPYYLTLLVAVSKELHITVKP